MVKLIEFFEAGQYSRTSHGLSDNQIMNMKKIILKTVAWSLFAAVLTSAPLGLQAQDALTNAATTQPNPPPHKVKKHDHTVFNGKVTAVDTNAMTLTVGKRTFEITSKTKISKSGLPAALADGVVGEPVGGAYKMSEDGKLTATSVNFGGKADGETKHKKHAHPENGGSPTNSVPN
jgi:hypothetical protein